MLVSVSVAVVSMRVQVEVREVSLDGGGEGGRDLDACGHKTGDMCHFVLLRAHQLRQSNDQLLAHNRRTIHHKLRHAFADGELQGSCSRVRVGGMAAAIDGRQCGGGVG